MKNSFKIPSPRMIVLANVLAAIAYWALVPAQLPEWAAIVAQSARMAMSFMVVVIFGWSIANLCWDDDRDPSDGLVIGIFLAFAADLYGSVQGLAWRWGGRPDEWTNTGFWLFATFLTTIAAMHHIAVPKAINGKVPTRNIIWLGAAIAIAILTAGVVLGSQLERARLLPPL